MANYCVKLYPREIREMTFPKARFLSQEEQGLYEEEIKQFTGLAYKSLNIPKEGSNLFKVLFLNQIGIHTATLLQLEDVVENNPEFLIGHYEDTPSIVVRSNGDSYKQNEYIAKLLTKKVNIRDFSYPWVLQGLEVKSDSNSAYGLVLVPGE